MRNGICVALDIYLLNLFYAAMGHKKFGGSRSCWANFGLLMAGFHCQKQHDVIADKSENELNPGVFEVIFAGALKFVSRARIAGNLQTEICQFDFNLLIFFEGLDM